MTNYEITFERLARAPQGVNSFSFVINGEKDKAVAVAESELLASGQSRSHFKAKPVIKEVEVETIDCEVEPEQAPLSDPLTELNDRIAALLPGELMALHDLSNDLYHASNGVSCSKLKTFIECPAKYHAKYIAATVEREQKAVFDLGTAFHTLVLEPEKFNAEIVVQPEEIKVRRGKAWDEFSALHEGKTIVSRDQFDAVQRMSEQVFANDFASRAFSGGVAETSYFKRDEETGLVIKCRTDYVLGDLIVDLKSARSSNPREFGRAAKSLGYHIQDAMYRDITDLSDFAFVVVESEAPHVVTAPILMDTEARRLGYLKYRDALRRLKRALDTNYFPGYSDSAEIISLTAWEKEELYKLEGAA